MMRRTTTPSSAQSETTALRADPKAHRWTRRAYHAIAETGVLDERPAGARVELIDGTILEMSPQSTRHASAIMLAQQALTHLFGADAAIRTQLPLAVNDTSEPEPDLAVVPGRARDYIAEQPASACLVIEVADTTLAFDRDKKASLYAAAGVDDYWLVNLHGNTVEVFRRRTAEPGAPLGHRYAEHRTHEPGQHIHPLARPDSSIAVDDLLP